MKTKGAVFLAVAILMVVSLMLPLGCATDTETEVTYKDLSVGPMTVSIPDDWQRPEDYEEFIEEFYAVYTAEERQAIQVDGYEDESEDAYIVPMTMDMVAMAESAGLTWRGWDIELGETGITAEDYAEMSQWALMAGFTELSRETHRQLTVGGHDAWETTYTGKATEVEPVQICLLIVFPPDDSGVLLMVVKEDKWSKFEDVWDMIRDSVQF